MNAINIFTTPIGHTRGEEFVSFARSLYEVTPLTFMGDLVTSLNDYIPGRISTNTGIPDSPELEKFKKFLIDSAIEFLDFLGYAADRYEFTISNLWLNAMNSGNTQNPHTHAGSLISGCFYVDTPPSPVGIVFANPSSFVARSTIEAKGITTAIAQNFQYLPTEGDLLVWESHLYHHVPPSNFEGIRRSIAFDVVATDIKTIASA